MRLAFASQLYAPIRFGGAELSTQLLCEALARRGHDVHILTTQLPGLMECETVNGVQVRRVASPNIYAWDGQKRPPLQTGIWHGIDIWNPVMLARARSWLMKTQADVFHTNTIAGMSVSLWQAARSLNLPVVHTLRDYYLMCPNSSMFRNGLNCFKQCLLCTGFSFAKRMASRQVSGIVGNSKFILKRHLEAGYFSKTFVKAVISNISGVCSTFRRNQSRSTTGPIKVGFLGRLHPSKGVETLLKAVKDVSSDSVVVRIGGEGQKEYEQKLKASFRQPNVQFVGKVQAEDFLKSVDLLVVPSLWHDPLPRVIFEAYACGVPVICSDRGGSKELVAEGVSGFVFNGGDSASLRTLLVRLTKENGLLNTLSQGAAGLAPHFTSGEIASAYEEVYAQVSKG